MVGSMLNIAKSGLMAFQRSIETTSHNISNIDTEGYSRQRVNLATKSPQLTGGGYMGTGVDVNNIARSYDYFINGQLRSSTSAFGEVDTFKSYASQVDNLMADSDTGLQPSLQGFFKAVNDVANDPTSIPARSVMLNQGEALTQRFGLIQNRYQHLREQVNGELENMTSTLSSYTRSIADLNHRISTDVGRANGAQQPNDLLDKRDVLVNKLAELVDITVLPKDNGMISIVMTNGQPLVLEGEDFEFGTQPNPLDPTQLEVTMNPQNEQPHVISHLLMGGKMAGTLRFRNEILDPAQQKLGAIAASVFMEVNALHKSGFDLDGQAGDAFFKIQGSQEIPVMAMTGNQGSATLSAGFNDTLLNPTGASSADLDTSDYLLKFDGAAYTLTRLEDNTDIALTASVGFPATLTPTNPNVKLPGMALNISAAPAAGDQFFIRPTFHLAENLQMNISDPRKIAAATNIGKDGVTVISGSMPGDNRNALKLAELLDKPTLFGHTTSLQEAYSQIVSDVGGLTHTANVSASAQEALLQRANEARENIAGVNLDEEAANLIKFQQSYQAAAQAISTASSLFDSLMGAVQ